MGNQLNLNQQLNVNDQLVSTNGKVKVIMQGDGNLVLYRTDNNKPLWASNTCGKPANHAIMQGDGNLVVYDASNRAFWATGTWNHPGSHVVLQDDGNFVLYSPGNSPLWASNTVVNWDPMTVDSGEQHIGTGFWMHSWASVASSGLISGHTRTWSTLGVKGFHGSVIAVLLDGDGKAVWPPNPEVTKHQYGVDGYLILWGTHDRTDYWANQADPAALQAAKSLVLIHFYDPKNMLLTDISIVAKTAKDIAALITSIGAVVAAF